MQPGSDELRAATAAIHVAGRGDTAGLLASEVTRALDTSRVDLCMLFASGHFEQELESVALELEEQLAPRAFIGMTGETVIAGGFEYETQPAIALFAAHMPNVQLSAFHVLQEDLHDWSDDQTLFDALGARPEDKPAFLLLADPFSFARGAMHLLDRIGDAFPGSSAIGGMASAGEQPDQNALIFEGQVLRRGLCGVTISGDVRVDAVVSQGCRPIGKHFVVTRAEQNVIYQLGGRPSRVVVEEMLQAIPAKDRELARERGLLIGRVINEYKGGFSRGDFLIRHPIGFDSASGAMAVNEIMRAGQTVQFHVRDSESASDDLRGMLAAQRGVPAAGALLFSCNGRGQRLFSDRNHDARELSTTLGGPPIAGCFCAGEFGPVGGRSYLHGHTASIALFRRRTDADRVG